MEISVIDYFKKTFEGLYHASTNLDKNNSRLVVSVTVGKREVFTFKFLENYNKSGYPVLILNMLSEPFGKSAICYLQLKIFLEWYYQRKIPIPSQHSFAGHRFFDWKPNSVNPILVFSWDKKMLSIIEINRLILGQEQK